MTSDSKTGSSGAIELYSSVGGAAFFESMLREWSANGYAVACHSAVDEGAYRTPATAIGRLWRRWQMYGGYAWRIWRSTRRGRDRRPFRIVTTNPFFAPALVRKAAGPRGFTVNLVYDLYPDVLVQAGVLREGSWLERRCAAVTRFAFRNCDATVFLGEHLRRHAESRFGTPRSAHIIAVGADGAPFRDHPPQLGTASDAVTILYAGQMGRMHDTDTVRAALAAGALPGLSFLFHSSGAGYRRLQKELTAARGCTWGGPLPHADWQRTMFRAQVALVTVAAGAEKMIMPSKTYSALVAGQAILAVCAADSDLADVVRRYDCGWVVRPGDVAGLQRCWQEIRSHPDLLWRKRQRAFTAGQQSFDSEVVACEWQQLYAALRARASAGDS